MSIKFSTVFYPHIVKEYTSIEQFITDNGYGDFYTAANIIQDRYIDRSDATIYLEGISDDGFEAIVTVSIPDQATYDAYHAEMQEIAPESKHPIYRENHPDANDEIHLF